MTRPPPQPSPLGASPITQEPVLHADAVSPADGDIEVPLNKSVTVDFNRDVDSDTLTASTFKIRKEGMLGYLTATRSYNSLTHRATLNPSADLQPGATYEVTITDGDREHRGPSSDQPQDLGVHHHFAARGAEPDTDARS